MLKRVLLACSLALAPLCHADIVIGQSVPTTGYAADTGKALALGAAIYFGRVNARGGVNGETINHVVRDDANDPARTVKNTQDLIEKENALALISFYGTDNVLQLVKSKLLDNAGIPLVGVHSGAEILRKANNPFVFHTRTSYNDEAERIIKLLTVNLGVSKIAVLAQQDAFGEAGIAALRTAMDKRQLKPLSIAYYDRNTGDTSKAAAELAKLNPEAVVLVAVSKPAATFVKQFKEKGGSSQLYAFSPVQFEDVGKLIGRNLAHGLGISQVYPYPYNTQLRFIREFEEDANSILRNNPAADVKADEYPSYALLEGYLSARLIVEAIKRAGKNPTRAAVYKALTSMNRYDLGGFVIDFNDKKRNGSNFSELTMISPSGALTR